MNNTSDLAISKIFQSGRNRPSSSITYDLVKFAKPSDQNIYATNRHSQSILPIGLNLNRVSSLKLKPVEIHQPVRTNGSMYSTSDNLLKFS